MDNNITMDFLNDSVLALFGRTDYVGGIDNEALDFGQLESFVHLPAINTSNNNANQSAITLAITAVSTAPVHTITTAASASTGQTNPPTHGTLPESPPDSGSEPPYSPTDLHAINNLNQIAYHPHHYPTNSQPPNPHQIDQTMHVNDGTSVDCHATNATSSIHKTEDILLSSTAMSLNNSVTNMMIPGNEMMMHQNTLGLGMHHPVNMGRNNMYRGDGNSLLTLNTEDDFSCLMTDPMFQMPPNGLSGHQSQNNHQPPQQSQQQQQTANAHSNVNSYNPHVLSQMPAAVVPTTHSNEIPHLLNSRKRTMSTIAQQNDYNAQSIIENSNDQSRVIPIKRSASVILPAIKPEPDALSPPCVSTLMEPSTPPSKSSVDVCSSISSCSTSITPPASTSIMMPSISESNSSPNLQQQGQNQANNNMENGSNDSFPMQCIRFSPFQQQSWHILCDQSLQELPLPHYRVDADKGFNFSNSDDAFVCQKKNHFQITCHAQAQGGPAIFVRTESGLEKIKSFHLHFYGVKLETPTQTIRIEQSQSDRSKKPFHPVPIDLQNRQVSKITVGRLHFSETTSNNMRKKGRPNPEQRYFQLVVGLHAHTHSGNFPVISQGSERIIVRASNPGQFESDVELCWQRGVTQDSIFTHANRVGINTDRPDESLVVHGNLKVSGHIVHPSDSRAKHEIGELDTSQQLQNVKRIRVVKYRYDPEFAVHHGLISPPAVHSTEFNETNECSNKNGQPNNVIDVIDTGVIAQEIREVLPDAVQEAGSVLLPSGEVIDNFLLVNKDRIYMENIGAVKELCKVTGSLQTRIEQLEKINSRRKTDPHKPDCAHSNCKFSQYDEDQTEPCSNKMIQITIVVLVIIMAICLAAISTLYFVEHSKQIDRHYYDGNELLLDRNYPGNSSYRRSGNADAGVTAAAGAGGGGGNSGVGGNGNVIYSNGNYWIPDRHITKKVPPKSTYQVNTQNASNAQQQVELAPQNVDIYSNGKSNDSQFDLDSGSKTTAKFHNTPEEVESHIDSDFLNPNLHPDFLNPNGTNDILRQRKLELSKYDNEVTTEKALFKAEKNVDTLAIISEPHDVYNDVESNIIDVGQQLPRNSSKTEDKNIAKPRNTEATENRNPLNAKDPLIFESEFHREVTVRVPIGLPNHCIETNASKSNRTPSELQQLPCPSFCGQETGKANQVVSDIPDAPEMAIPENIDLIETSTLFKVQKIATTKLAPVERKIDMPELSTTMGEDTNHSSVEQTTTKDVIDRHLQEEKIITSSIKEAIQAEQPIEVRDSSILTSNTSSQTANFTDKVESGANERTAALVDIQKKPNKAKESIDASPEMRPQELEPDEQSRKLIENLENDIKSTFNKKIESKFEKVIPEDGIEISKPTNGNIEQLPSYTAPPQIPAPTPTLAIPIEPTNPACFFIYVVIRSETFNITVGTDEICHNFNFTYNIPLSKYMKESRFEIVFITENRMQWTLCSMKEGTGKESNVNLDSLHITDKQGIESHASFEVDIPTSVDFERQLEFQANLQSSDLATPCRSPASVNGNSLQTILYKVNIYRDCTQ